MAQLSFGVTWGVTLESDLTAYMLTQLNPAVATALQHVAEDMRQELAERVQIDVYDKYTPSVYKRRPDWNSMLAQAWNATIYQHGASGFDLEYKPSGSYPGHPEWGTGPNKSGYYVYNVDSDELIGRIEKHDPEYNWLPKNRAIPNRPFWQNFVKRAVDEGEIEASFVRWMRTGNKNLDIVEDGALYRDAGDGDY